MALYGRVMHSTYMATYIVNNMNVSIFSLKAFTQLITIRKYRQGNNHFETLTIASYRLNFSKVGFYLFIYIYVT